MFQIGPYKLASSVVLAPMAGVTDLPFRRLCKRLGAGLVVSEMLSSDVRLWNTRKSRQRRIHSDEAEPRSVQIAGGDPLMMAQAARLAAANGAQIIDINMGCPAKKVCKKAAGSALMKDEQRVEDILSAVITAVEIPVTLKIRTGWSTQHRNGTSIARIAEDCGVMALAVHGRTRACGFSGEAEYDTIRAIKASVNIPVIANGDIDSPQKARAVMDYTGADAVMVGRAAQGRPWICKEIDQFLRNGVIVAAPAQHEVRQVLHEHLDALYTFYGELMGVRIARKHVGWYLKQHFDNNDFKRNFNSLESAYQQQQAIDTFFEYTLKPKENAA